MGNTCNITPLEILNKIFTVTSLTNLRPVFFVDLSCVTIDQANIPTLVQLAIGEKARGWYVVIAHSSGAGWKIDLSTTVLKRVRYNLETLDNSVKHLESTAFNDMEAKKYVNEVGVDVKRLEEEHIDVANNPYLLHLFRGTVSNDRKFEVSVRWFWYKITELTRTFISTLRDEVYGTTFNGCLTFLECARHNVNLKPSQVEQYKRSYLKKEYLTVLEGDKESPRIKLLFPPMYNKIVQQLKSKFEDHDAKVCALPIVKGYLFESRLLQNRHLSDLSISAMNEAEVQPTRFRFSSLIPAYEQQSGPIRCLTDNEICHLRPQHPAIDGVCVALDSNDDKYLLLLQVSISEYRLHESKGIDIRNEVDKKFEGKVCNRTRTIAEYYKDLAGVEDNKVIYVYISPKEVRPPDFTTFRQELRTHFTRSGSRPPQYFYGFCVDSKKVVEHCLPQ